MTKSNFQKGFIIPAIIIVIAIAVLGAGYFSSKSKSNSSAKVMTGGEVMVKDNDTSAPKTGEDTMMKKEEGSMVKTDADVMVKAGTYEAYSPEKIASKSASGNVVLFFRAGWCPTCRALDANIKANLGLIPANLTILDVNYDNSTELKKKYGVTYQHTMVQVDKNGTLIKKWSGSPTLASFVAEVK